MGEFAKVVDVQYLEADLIPIFLELANDSDGSVRSYVVEACVSIAHLVQQGTVTGSIEHLVMPTLRECLFDSSCCVRNMFADKICDLQEAVGPDFTHTDLVPAFESLLADKDAQARSTAASKLEKFRLKLDTTDQLLVNDAMIIYLLTEQLKCMEEMKRESKRRENRMSLDQQEIMLKLNRSNGRLFFKICEKLFGR